MMRRTVNGMSGRDKRTIRYGVAPLFLPCLAIVMPNPVSSSRVDRHIGPHAKSASCLGWTMFPRDARQISHTSSDLDP